MRSLNYFIGGLIVAGSLVFSEAAYSQMTGSSGTHNYGQTGRTSSPGAEMRSREFGKKFFDNVNPIPSPLMKGLEKFGDWYGERNRRTGNVTGTSRTTEENRR